MLVKFDFEFDILRCRKYMLRLKAKGIFANLYDVLLHHNTTQELNQIINMVLMMHKFV